MRLKHFPTEEILNYIEDKLETALQSQVKSHLDDCSKCKKEAATLAGITGLMLKDRSFDAPSDSVVWAKNLFRTRIPKTKTSPIKKIFALLQMDISQGQAFAERSATSSVRQMLYRADENTLDIRVMKDDKLNNIAGQILGEDFSGCETQLRKKGKSFMSAINDMNEFKFSGIESGKYQMIIRKKEIELILEDIEF